MDNTKKMAKNEVFFYARHKDFEGDRHYFGSFFSE